MVATKGRLIQAQKMLTRGRVKDFKVYTEGERMEVPDSLDKVHKVNSIPCIAGGSMLVSDSKCCTKHSEKIYGKSNKGVGVPVGRKALADIDNLNPAFSRTEQRKVSRFGNRYTMDLRNKEPSPPDKPLMGRVRADLSRAALETKSLPKSVKRNTKVTSDDDKRTKCRHNSIAAGVRTSVRIPIHLTRKSLPTLRQASQLETRAMTKERSEKSEKLKAKHGFLMKSSVGKGIIPNPSSLRSRNGSERVSDGFTLMKSRAQSKVETGLVPGKSLRENARGDLAQAAAEKKCSLEPVKTNTKVTSDQTRAKFQGRNSLNANSRKLLPALKPVSRVETSSMTKESSERSQKFNGKHGFLVKSSFRKSNVPNPITLSSRPRRNRVSDGFAVMPSRTQNKMEPGMASRKPPVLNAKSTSKTLDHQKKSQPSHVFPMKKLRSSPDVTNKRKQKVSMSKDIPSEVMNKRKQEFLSKDAPPTVALEECTSEEVMCTNSSHIGSSSSDSITKRRSSRRNSFTYSLLSGSKECSNVTPEKPLPNIYDERNHLEVSDYVDDIYCYYWFMEAQNPPLKNYFEIQQNLTPQMRGILINWLVEVHLKFNLKEETLFLTVTLLDRYLSLQCIKRNEMQLVGLTALLLASKYEDYWHPTVADLTSISVESYTRHQMLQMEKTILKTLKFRLNEPTLYVFMLRFLKAAQLDMKFEHLAFYLIELCLVEYEALNYKPSMLCASAVYVARCTMKIAPVWTPLLTKHTRYNESEIRGCAEMIMKFHKAAKTSQLNVIYDKYTKQGRNRVANLPPLNRIPV